MGLTGLVAACAFAAVALGSAVLARHKAGNAADLAALAAAVHADADDCAWADTVARKQGARLVACRCADAVCDVETAVDTPWGAADVVSRAGPASAAEDAAEEVRPAVPDDGVTDDVPDRLTAPEPVPAPDRLAAPADSSTIEAGTRALLVERAVRAAQRRQAERLAAAERVAQAAPRPRLRTEAQLRPQP